MKWLDRWMNDAKAQPDVRYVDTCDGLRTLAVLMVGWFHIWQQSWLGPYLHIGGRSISFDPYVRSGYMWVDVMIMISGFCLYLPWARTPADEARLRDVPGFYMKRLARFHPSYLLCVLVMLCVAVKTDAYYNVRELRRDLLTHLTYTELFTYGTYYATNLGANLWTIVVEMQLYLLFPLLARLFRRSPLLTLLGACGLSMLCRGWLANYGSEHLVMMVFNQLPCYLDTFVIGMTAALIHVRLSGVPRGALARVLCSAAAAAVLLAMFSLGKLQSRSSGYHAIRLGQMNHRAAMSLLSAAFLVLSANAGLVLRRILSNPLTKWFSAISMQFYIWHQTIAVWILEARLVPSAYENPNYDGDLHWQIIYTAVCFVVPLILGTVLTYLFERPVSRGWLRLWNRLRTKKRVS